MITQVGIVNGRETKRDLSGKRWFSANMITTGTIDASMIVADTIQYNRWTGYANKAKIGDNQVTSWWSK